ncbi:hypothetical protein B0J17DRAFT_345560 [Rhizoctonia solani]|nr:hypothetical protein B0J17DRAFT_345560 [Rhizoctonia solani]
MCNHVIDASFPTIRSGPHAKIRSNTVHCTVSSYPTSRPCAFAFEGSYIIVQPGYIHPVPEDLHLVPLTVFWCDPPGLFLIALGCSFSFISCLFCFLLVITPLWFHGSPLLPRLTVILPVVFFHSVAWPVSISPILFLAHMKNTLPTGLLCGRCFFIPLPPFLPLHLGGVRNRLRLGCYL